MSSIMSTHTFFPSLKRQSAIRNRTPASSAKSSSPSTKGRRLQPLMELSEEDEDMPSLAFSLAPSPSPAHGRVPSIGVASSSIRRKDITPFAPGASTRNKRISRYGKAEFSASGDLEDLRLMSPRPAPRPPVAPSLDEPVHFASHVISPRPSRPASIVSLSGFDMTIDIPPPPPMVLSPINDNDPTPISSRPPIAIPSPRRRRHASQSPTPSMSSNATTSSGSSGSPCTPTTSDDESPMFSAKPAVPQRISIRPLVITKSMPSIHSPDASPIESFEFTIAPSASDDAVSDSEIVKTDDECLDDGEWYTREMSDTFTLFSSTTMPTPTSAKFGPTRPDSLSPPPCRSDSSSVSRRGRSRMSKPLPDIPRTPGPSAQLDPTFPRRKRSVPRIPTYPPPPPPQRKPLTIKVPARPPPRESLPADVMDILDDIASWDFPSATSPSEPLSPPRLPETPRSSGDEQSPPVERSRVHRGAPLAADVPNRHDDAVHVRVRPDPVGHRLDLHCGHSRVAARARMPCGLPFLVARLVRVRPGGLRADAALALVVLDSLLPRGGPARTSKGAEKKERTMEIRKDEEREVRARRSMESAKSGSSADSSSSSGLRRKPIPIEIFMRQ
ncbi:hypothetical protein EVG20_g3467 [Dentipellis fragilis]|uniref:Uncharacterized protein n=1 Tax=Dentipellis fragilis TaxID=205917 RepID=A0A4Y9Z241_9AGAM|nr:hypothetical protein EVG20_g3467 [Dentipellis fragilis]